MKVIDSGNATGLILFLIPVSMLVLEFDAVVEREILRIRTKRFVDTIAEWIPTAGVVKILWEMKNKKEKVFHEYGTAGGG